MNLYFDSHKWILMLNLSLTAISKVLVTIHCGEWIGSLCLWPTPKC